MNDNPLIYKSNQISIALPSCTLDLDYFVKLYSILDVITKEAAEIEVLGLEKKPDQSEEDFNNLKNYAKSLYKVNILIFGSKGEYLASEHSNIFNESMLPDHIDRIIFDSSSKYNFHIKKDPSNKIKVEFDFTKTKVFDFTTNPSTATLNTSKIYVIGENETWVSGAYKKTIDSLQERSNNRNWLHQSNIYDLFLWFLIIPSSFITLYKIDKVISACLTELSTVFITALYIYFFLVLLFICRMVFNYSKWVFPKMELETSLKKGAIKHRIFLIGLLLAILYPIIKDLILDSIKLLFR